MIETVIGMGSIAITICPAPSIGWRMVVAGLGIVWTTFEISGNDFIRVVCRHIPFVARGEDRAEIVAHPSLRCIESHGRVTSIRYGLAKAGNQMTLF